VNARSFPCLIHVSFDGRNVRCSFLRTFAQRQLHVHAHRTTCHTFLQQSSAGKVCSATNQCRSHTRWLELQVDNPASISRVTNLQGQRLSIRSVLEHCSNALDSSCVFIRRQSPLIVPVNACDCCSVQSTKIEESTKKRGKNGS
jgi:hypothetical protein